MNSSGPPEPPLTESSGGACVSISSQYIIKCTLYVELEDLETTGNMSMRNRK